MKPSLTEKRRVIRYSDLNPKSYNSTPICPVCKCYVNYGFKFKHCPNCGQLLRWENIQP